MNCPGCGTSGSTVYKTLDDGVGAARQRRCKCGGRWYTDEKVRRGSFVVMAVPLVTGNEPAVTTAHYSGSDQVLSLGPLSTPDQTAARVNEPPQKPPVFAGMPLAAKGQTWDVPAAFDARVAEAFPAIDRPVEYAKAKAWLFTAAKNRKTAGGMERFLFTWFSNAQNRGKAATVGGRTRDTRCAFHLNWSNHLRKPPGGWYAECPECKEARAAMGDRRGDPTRTVDLVAATEAKLARDRTVTLPSADEMAELRAARGT